MTLTAAEIPFASNPPMPGTWRLLDDVELQKLPDPTWIVDGTIPTQGIVGLYGPSGACKTTSIAGMLVAIATGEKWHGRAVKRQGNVIYLGAEDVSGFKLRLAAAKRAAGLSLLEPIGVFTFPEAIDLRDPVSVGRFIQLVKYSGDVFVVIVIDTFAASTPGSNENSSEDMTAAISSAQRIRHELGVTVIIVHHTNASGSRERGHSAMRGAADTMISLTPVDDVYHLECSKQRNGPPFDPIELKLTPIEGGGVVLRLNADVLPNPHLTTLQAKALDALREAAGADGITKAAWRTICGDMNERAFYKVAKVLEERKCVSKVGTSHYRASGGGK